jgi:hypothetical protein
MPAQAAPVGAASRPRTRRLDVRTAGTITIAGSALGIAFAAAILLTPPMVPSTRFSYPFDATWFVVAQLLFAVQHLAMIAGVGFVLAGWVVARRRLLTWGRWLPFAFGVWVFVILMPALFGPLVAGRLALDGWLALYVLLGVALRR